MKKIFLIASLLFCFLASAQSTGKYFRLGKLTTAEIAAITIKTQYVYTAFDTDLGYEVINVGAGWVQRFVPGGGSADGSETKIQSGTNVTVTGTGTIADPYIISAIDTDTQLSNAQVEAAYNNQVPIVSQVDAEAGTSTNVFRFTPQRLAQAILALGNGVDEAANYNWSGLHTYTGIIDLQGIQHIIGTGSDAGWEYRLSSNTSFASSTSAATWFSNDRGFNIATGIGGNQMKFISNNTSPRDYTLPDKTGIIALLDDITNSSDGLGTDRDTGAFTVSNDGDTSTLNDGVVSSSKITANAVTSSKIAEDAITLSKLNDGSNSPVADYLLAVETGSSQVKYVDPSTLTGSGIQSNTTGEPTGTEEIPKLVNISEADYEAAVLAGSLVAGTTYVIKDASPASFWDNATNIPLDDEYYADMSAATSATGYTTDSSKLKRGGSHKFWINTVTEPTMNGANISTLNTGATWVANTDFDMVTFYDGNSVRLFLLTR